MKAKDLRDMNMAELEAKLAELREEMFKLRFQQATNQLDNPMRIVEVRKSIAQILTILREDELKEEGA